MPSSKIIQWDEQGAPLALANGRARNDGRCVAEEHAYPITKPHSERVGDNTAISESCVSCRTVRTVLLSPDGEILDRSYRYPRPE